MIHLVTLDAPPQRTGGIASWVQDVGAALCAQGVSVTLHAPQAPSARAWDAAQTFGVHRMWGRSWGRHQGRWIQLQLPRRVAQGDRVIYSTWRLAEHCAGKLKGRATQLVMVHGSDLTQIGADATRFVRTCGQVNAVGTVSSFLGEMAAELGVASQVVPMPLARAAASTVRSRELLVVARLTPLKGVDRAISLAAALERPLRVLGEGPERERLQALAGPGVVFEGRVSRTRVYEAMASASATLLLSRVSQTGRGAEGLGLVLLEAQARGCPVIASGVGGLPEAAFAGLILPSPDAPDLDRVQGFLRDSRAGVRARQWVQAHHSPILCVHALLEALS